MFGKTHTHSGRRSQMPRSIQLPDGPQWLHSLLQEPLVGTVAYGNPGRGVRKT